MTMGSIELSVLFPAFLAGLLVLSTHVPMGQQVLGRGIVFIDLAIAQVAGLGVTLAGAMGTDPQGWVVQVAACSRTKPGGWAGKWAARRLLDVWELGAGGSSRRWTRASI